MVNYNVDSLRAAIERHKGNIANFERAIEGERASIAQMQGHIEEALSRPPTNFVIDGKAIQRNEG